jgi:hypothetical protein
VAVIPWLKNLLRAKPAESPPPESSPEDRDVLADVREYVSTAVRSGFQSRDEIVESVSEMAADEGSHDVDIAALVDAAIADLQRESLGWPAVTDYDRLTAALEALEQRGIVARQNFTCCQSCGHAEIGDELEQFEAAGGVARGYVFFHQQATEGAVDGEDINFAYGSTTEAVDSVEIASELAAELRQAGLQVDWNGESSMCVMVGLDWKRRWPEHQT